MDTGPEPESWTFDSSMDMFVETFTLQMMSRDDYAKYQQSSLVKETQAYHDIQVQEEQRKSKRTNRSSAV